MDPIVAFIIGLVIGIGISLIIRIRDVKSISLDLKRIGVALGAEGFEDNSVPQVSQTVTNSAGAKVAGRDLIEALENQQNEIEELNQTVQNIQKTIESDLILDHESRLYTYKYRDDIPRIHRDLNSALEEGWFIQNITPLIDYEGLNRLWVVLSRSRSGQAQKIKLIVNED